MDHPRILRSPEERRRDAETLFTFLSRAEPPPQDEPADLVLAMGSQDLTVADMAARAFHATGARYLVCSGGFGKDTARLFQEPEAVLFGRRCRALGVPEDRLLLEDRATNSGENFTFTKKLLTERGIVPHTGVIATKPYMARRGWATAVWQWPSVRWSVFPWEITLAAYLSRGNDPRTVVELMTGDLQRMRLYAGRYQAAVEVPDAVWAAYERLAADGYDRYVVREQAPDP